jgi:peptidoglycan DL-endopeptidase CwlO
MRCLARRLLPLAAFLLVLGLLLAGEFGQGRLGGTSQPAGPGGNHRTGVTGAAKVGLTTGLSRTVGIIPGSRPATGSAGRRGYSLPARLSSVAARPLPTSAADAVPALKHLLPSDLLVVAPITLPAKLISKLRKLHGVAAAVRVDAGRIRVNNVFVNVIGVDPAAFRPFAARPTARSVILWQNVAAGGMAISYTMGKQAKLRLSRPVQVTGTRTLRMPVAGFGTVGIGGVDAMVSDQVARQLGLPAGNAIVISAPHANLATLMAAIKKLAPARSAVAALVTQVVIGGTTVTSAAAGALGVGAGQGQGLTRAQLIRFLVALRSRLGLPYVWGGNGPRQFDCSGLVQWAMAQAGVTMPRVAADQARTGPLLPLADLQPGDLLFYHTDPTAPNYISHVAIYLGNGLMEQAPEPGMTVQIVRADFGAGFAGAIRVYPRIAAAVAGSVAG